MLNCLAVGIGGFFGSIFRYLIGTIPLKTNMVFPISTLAINILGAFIIGMVTTLATEHATLDPKLLLLLKVGLCGGFTTFSTFSNDTLGLIQSGKLGLAFVYALASVSLCVLSVFFGTQVKL